MQRILIPALVVVLLVAAGCASGPSSLSRSVDDWQNNNYEDSPLTTGLLTDVLPFYPLVKALAYIPDWLVLNPVQFWGDDVWDGEGAAFVHENPGGKKTPWFEK